MKACGPAADRARPGEIRRRRVHLNLALHGSRVRPRLRPGSGKELGVLDWARASSRRRRAETPPRPRRVRRRAGRCEAAVDDESTESEEREDVQGAFTTSSSAPPGRARVDSRWLVLLSGGRGRFTRDGCRDQDPEELLEQGVGQARSTSREGGAADVVGPSFTLTRTTD